MMSVEFLLNNIYSLVNKNEITDEELTSLEGGVQHLIGIIAIEHANPEEFSKCKELSGRLHQIAQANPNFQKLVEIDNTFANCIFGQEGRPPIAPTIHKTQTIVKVPRPVRENLIDKAQLNAWIEAHELPKNMRALKVLAEKIVHISQEQFECALQETIQHLNGYLKETGDTYVLGVEDFKSNRWVSQLAAPYFLYPALGEASIVFAEYLSEYAIEKAKNPQVTFPKCVVLFDDAAYSGEQLTRVVRGIIQSVDSFNNKTVNEKISMPKVIIACPYMTDFSQTAIRKFVSELMIGENEKAHSALMYLTILPCQRIFSIKELIPDSAILATLTQMWWPSEAGLAQRRTPEGSPRVRTPEGSPRMSPRARVLLQSAVAPVEKDISVSQIAHKKGVESRATVYFSFKIPDKDSFIAPLATGTVVQDGRVSRSIKPFKIIPKTVPPYKPNFEDFCKEIAEKAKED